MTPDKHKPAAASDTVAFLRRVRLFEMLDAEELRDLAALGRVIHVEPETRLFEKGDPGDHFYAVLSGQIAAHTSSENGKTLILAIIDPGDVLGEIALLDGLPRPASGSTLTACDLFRLDRASFIEFLEARPKLCFRLMGVLCDRVRCMSDTIEDTVFLDAPRRLARRLLRLAENYGREIDDGRIRIQLPLSQESLASMLGITREMVNKSLKSLKAAGAVTYMRGYLVLDDLDHIRGLARSKHEPTFPDDERTRRA